MVRWIAVVALALAVLTHPAHSQQVIDARDFGILCAPAGLMPACAHVSVWSEVNPATDTYLFWVSVQNMQGQPGFEHLPVAGVAGWYFGNVAVVGCTDYGETEIPCEATGPYAGDFLKQRIEFYGYPTLGNYTTREWMVVPLANGLVYVGNDLASNSNDFLWGCTIPTESGGRPTNGSSTCDEPGIRGMDLGDGARFSATSDIYLDIWWSTVDGASSSTCSTNPEASWNQAIARGGTCVRVPEPSSLLLLATGGLGLAYVRRRREA